MPHIGPHFTGGAFCFSPRHHLPRVDASGIPGFWRFSATSLPLRIIVRGAALIVGHGSSVANHALRDVGANFGHNLRDALA